jgi:NitT/TauT family transport system substrate-binding protein
MHCQRLISLCLLAAVGLVPALALAADAVTVQLDWVVRGDHAPFFVARDKGFFRDQDIEISAIEKGSGSVNALRLVANGNAAFGFADLPTLLVARGQGLPVVALVAVNQVSPLAMIALKKNHVLNSIDDFKSLNVGVDPLGSTFVFMKAILAANKIPLDSVKQSTMSRPYENFLLLNRVDVVPGYVDAEVPELEAKAGGPGSLSILLGASVGYAAYGSGLFTSEKMIADHPDEVQRFVTAYVKGFNATVQNPQDAVAVTVAANPEYQGKTDVLTEQLHADLTDTLFSADTKAHGIGWIEPARWNATATMLHDFGGGLNDVSKAQGGFDTRFLAAAAPMKE